LTKHLTSLAVLLFVYALNAATTIDDTLFGYTITLPDNWVLEYSDERHHRFVDTTQTYTAIIVFERYDFGGELLFTEADEWTRANFLAYTFVVDADPLSSVLFYDTVSTRSAGERWAADAYSVYYDMETSSADIAEFIRYTAVGTWGYEIYAIGPLADMKANVGVYAGIIQGIVIREVAEAALLPVSLPMAGRRIVSPVSHNFDLLGRTVPLHSTRYASRLTVAPRTRSCMFR
jgi:hypothetical protein